MTNMNIEYHITIITKFFDHNIILYLFDKIILLLFITIQSDSVIHQTPSSLIPLFLDAERNDECIDY